MRTEGKTTEQLEIELLKIQELKARIAMARNAPRGCGGTPCATVETDERIKAANTAAEFLIGITQIIPYY